mmetsp:Transcript_36154/g.80453  ORF Transcript_36154/g.80453 Transcript_36154/m.80453 type:complete len:116 (+) Transcript_36154:197-544(+)
MDNPSPTVESVDGEVFPTEKARTLSKRMFYFGFLFLPLLWFVNCWLFWHDFRGRPGADLVIKKFTRFSAIGFTISSCLFLPWFLFYIIAGKNYMDEDLYRKIDVTKLKIIDELGI